MPNDHPCTWQELIDGVVVIGFVPRGAGDESPDATYEQDVAEFKSRLEELHIHATSRFGIVDFENYESTWENGRALVGLVLNAHRKLVAQGGGIFVCNHPDQFNPDRQEFFWMDKVINISRSRQQALEAVRSRIDERNRSDT